MPFPFNVRVYGLLIDEGRILLSDEQRGDFQFTKFPGGGLEFGEGTIEAVKREFMEEIGIEPTTVEHFYTTDFFQESAFNAHDQVISIYYAVEVESPGTLPAVQEPFDFTHANPCVRWVDLHGLGEDQLTFPIDKHVLGMLKATYSSV